MSDFDVPWAIEHAKHPASLARRQAQRQAGTGSGVDRPGDLKVQALNVPGTGFRVAPGGGVAQSRDSTATARESYGPLLRSEMQITDVPGTGSSGGRRDLVILEITDPEMESVTYSEPPDAWGTGGWLDGDNFCRITIIPGVASSVTSLDQITTGPFKNVTGITLAAITWPASTGTITDAMITDLRRLQNPKSDRVFRPADLTVLQRLDGTGAEGVQFPNELTGLIGQIDIPEGMTHARISSTLANVRVPAGASTGQFWVQLGTNADPARVVGPASSFDPAGSSDTYRESWLYGATVAIPAAARGTTKSFIMKARVNASRPEAQQIYIDTAGSAIVDIEFFQQAI